MPSTRIGAARVQILAIHSPWRYPYGVKRYCDAGCGEWPCPSVRAVMSTSWLNDTAPKFLTPTREPAVQEESK